jgi:hypothetical protein
MWFYDISVRGESKRCDFNPFFFLKLKKTDLQMSAKRKFITTVYVSSFEIKKVWKNIYTFIQEKYSIHCFS